MLYNNGFLENRIVYSISFLSLQVRKEKNSNYINRRTTWTILNEFQEYGWTALFVVKYIMTGVLRRQCFSQRTLSFYNFLPTKLLSHDLFQLVPFNLSSLIRMTNFNVDNSNRTATLVRFHLARLD